jgi:hypothetical protein
VKKVVAVVVMLLALTAAALAVAAATVKHTVSARLTPGADVPKPKGAAKAKGSFSGTYVVEKKDVKLTWNLAFAGLSGGAKAAHIHLGKPGVSGKVIVALCAPCTSGRGGTSLISKAVLKSIQAGRTYVNVHTKKNPAGEIRGQVRVGS